MSTHLWTPGFQMDVQEDRATVMSVIKQARVQNEWTIPGQEWVTFTNMENESVDIDARQIVGVKHNADS